MLCDISNDFGYSQDQPRVFWSAPKGDEPWGARMHSAQIAKLSFYSACSSREKKHLADGGYVFCDVCPVHHIWINCFIIYTLIYYFRSAQSSVCWKTKPLTHFPTCQVEPMLESQQLIWVELNCSKRCTIHVAISKLIGSMYKIRLRIDVCPKPNLGFIWTTEKILKSYKPDFCSYGLH